MALKQDAQTHSKKKKAFFFQKIPADICLMMMTTIHNSPSQIGRHTALGKDKKITHTHTTLMFLIYIFFNVSLNNQPDGV